MRLACLLLLLPAAHSAQERPIFEAATVKAVAAGRTAVPSLRGGPGTNSPGLLSGAATLKAILMRAYGLKSYQIAGPAWMDSNRYEITAKIPAGADAALVSAMLQSLVAERFRLVVHRESREMPVYSLEVAKGGPRFHESALTETSPQTVIPSPRLTKGADGFPEILPGSNLPRSYQLVLSGPDGSLYKVWARHETMPQLAERLSAQLDRPVTDRTGLRGAYDFVLSWTWEGGGEIRRMGPPPDQIESQSTPVLPETGISLFTAVQVQLGLRLESGKAPVEMLIVDSAEKVPVEN